MAFATMHFATGMVCSGAAGVVLCTVLRRGWRWLPLGMTAGGFWAMVLICHACFGRIFSAMCLCSTNWGEKSLQNTLHQYGDIFFFHRWLDTHRTEDRLALQGMTIIIGCYVLSILMLMFMEWRSRNSEANRFWQTHKPYLDRVQQAQSKSPTPGDPTNPVV